MSGHDGRYHASPHLLSTLAMHDRSQRWLARKVGVSAQQMNQVIRGLRTIGEAEAFRAAVALGVPVEALFLSASRDEMTALNDEEAA